MRITLFFFFLFILTFHSVAQTTINGTVLFTNGKPVELATVYIKGTLDVKQTDAAGKFTLVCKLIGKQTLIIRSEEIEELVVELNLDGSIITREFKVMKTTKIEDVIITAGSIEANNDRAVALLNPIDIVTTAGGQGDIAGALQTLPGVQRNGGDQTGLMVRGGDVSESAVMVDGLVAQNAFGSTVPGVAQRTRFSPFQFKGTSFSSGGYTARYGQALSSILDLSTNDLPAKTTINTGASFAGVYLSGSQLMDKSAVEFSGSYQNLTPFLLISQPNVAFYEAPTGFGLSGRYVAQTNTRGIFKTTIQQGYNSSGITITDPVDPSKKINFGIKNENTYTNTSFKNPINEKWLYFVGFSTSNNTDRIEWDGLDVTRDDRRVQGRGEFVYSKSNRFRLLMGSDVQHFSFTQQFDSLIGGFTELQSAAYVEADVIPFRGFAIKPGVRAEYSQLLGKGNISPRLAMAAKTGKNGQVSFASGLFYQTAATNYLMFGYRPDFQEALHLMLNYQLMKNDRILRVEGYYKSYDQLVRENGTAFTPNAFRFDLGQVDNSGYGYAQGIDFFWRDRKSIKSFDYWISYSYIDTKRLYQNYVAEATPDYVSNHNLNVVMKYFWMKMQTNISATYSYASGRPYYNPMSQEFFGDRAPDFHNFAITLSYLTTIKKMFSVFYISLDNITNQKNVLGYRYNDTGTERYEMLPPFYFNVFFGFNLSLTEFNKDEL
jgi:hypothetical protein